MKESRSISGQWEIYPGTPAAFGVLEFHPEKGLALNVNIPKQRTLPETLMEQLDTNDPPFVVSGVDRHGVPITLFGCTPGKTRSATHLDEIEITPMMALVGGRVENVANARFQIVEVHYSLLDCWLPRKSIIRKPDEPAWISQTAAPEIEATLANGTRLKISMRVYRDSGEKLSLYHRQFVKFQFAEALPILDIRNNYINLFRDCLAFLTGEQVFVDSIAFPDKDATQGPVEWLYPQAGFSTAERNLNWPEHLVPHSLITAELPQFLTRWFDYCDRIDPVLNLYFTTRAAADMAASVRFLLLAQALEAYHSRSGRFRTEVQERQEFETRRKLLLEAIPEGERAWLTEKLQHANQKTLAQRLADLIGEHRTSVLQFVPDPELFANVIRWTRNYYTHYDAEEEKRFEKGQGRIARGADLIRYATQMRGLLELLFAQDLRLPPEVTRNIIEQAQNWEVISVTDAPPPATSEAN